MKLITLTRGYSATVDDKWFDYLNQFSWYAEILNGEVKARRAYWVNGKMKHICLHQLILPAKPGFVVDHKNRNTLDNREENLRYATVIQNLGNRSKSKNKKSSKYRGVTWNKECKIWIASIRKSYKFCYLGRFHDEKSAALAYDRAAIDYFGEFANPNFPDGL